MPNDKTKIVSFAADLYISATGADHSDGSANHTILGWMEEGATQVTKSDEFTKELHHSQDLDLGGKFKLETMGLETDAAKLTALEAFITQDVDIVLINRADRATGEVYANGTLKLAPDFKHTLKDTKKFKLEVTFAGKKLSDIYSELAGATGYS